MQIQQGKQPDPKELFNFDNTQCVKKTNTNILITNFSCLLRYGVEINDLKIAECIQKGVPVIKQDIDKGINEFISSNFDLSIMARSIQCLKNPDLALNEMLQISKRCVVTVPNLGYWRCRINLASGKMPVTPELPSSWYETENIHLCTIKDFEKLCLDKNIKINKIVGLNENKTSEIKKNNLEIKNLFSKFKKLILIIPNNCSEKIIITIPATILNISEFCKSV